MGELGMGGAPDQEKSVEWPGACPAREDGSQE